MEFIEIKALKYYLIHLFTHTHIYYKKLYSTEHELESCGE